MRGRGKAKSITLSVLEFLLSIPTATVDGFMSKSAVFDKYKNNKTLTYDLRVWIENLKQRGYVEEQIDSKDEGNNRSVRLTNKAKLKVLDCVVGKIAIDNQYRFVTFDIPEDMRKNRNKFREALKSMGFKKIQASLWVTNKNLGELVEMVAYEYKVEKYIAYIISEKSDIDGYIAKLFK